MEADDLRGASFRVLTYRDGRQVICESVETEVAARTRFASAIDLCRARDDDHAHRVELWPEHSLLEARPEETSA
ncbi:hypothetical protein [Methylobacterium radiodurans]|uniref:Uncharacterized protein n=1 Tax=Methylobacterium radiodurans TaxID=2202828 RepID=A0A2U8VUY6_9HYPH|nr:hypothetical protein [Methylobacterium radiodurans]AWN37208.1 hypothetical protein DK427_16960 [Methylobacterium radiodurans]